MYRVPKTVPDYIDSHAHTNFDRFDEDRSAMYDRARAAGIVAIVEVGVGLAGSLAAVARAESEPMVSAAAGLHPTGVGTFEEEWEEFQALVRSGAPVAVGECGLDYYWIKEAAPRKEQAVWFARQLELAREVGVAFIVHCREAEADLVPILREVDYGNGVVHCFGGSAAQAEAILELGLSLSFCGNLTYRKNSRAQEAARTVPLDRLLLETDSPFMSPQSKRGRRNEPAHLVETAEFLAELKGVGLEELATATTANSRRLFSL